MILEKVQASGTADISWKEFVAYFGNPVPSVNEMQGTSPGRLVGNVKPCDLRPPPPPAVATAPQVSDPNLFAWLASLKQQPVHHGLLGLEEDGRVVEQYCVLFKGSLHSWEQPLAATSGQKPKRRILLSSLCCIAKVSDGIILRIKGRVIKLYRAQPDLDLWHKALQSTLFCSQPQQSPHRFMRTVATSIPAQQRPKPVLHRAALAHQASKKEVSINAHEDDGQVASAVIQGDELKTPPRRTRKPRYSP